MKKFFIYWLPVISYAALIFYLSHQTEVPDPVPLPFVDKIAHFIEYAVFSFLIMRALKASDNRHWRINFFLIGVTMAILYALTDEWHQSFIPERTMDVADLFFDSLGAVCGRFFMR